jgi:hypothetical protein
MQIKKKRFARTRNKIQSAQNILQLFKTIRKVNLVAKYESAYFY